MVELQAKKKETLVGQTQEVWLCQLLVIMSLSEMKVV